MRHVVVGTAGHVDHGKTALVKALSGTDTDRWEEEKRRGITIDLGFAELELDARTSASIVDVPGHEDFVRNMLAGATGIDVALLVVAADEGIMPQTLEHLAILEFLDVRSGVIALTKCDQVEEEWLQLVTEDVRDRLRESVVKWSDIVHTSAVTGQGVDQLQERLADAAQRVPDRSRDDLFRLPVDRVFSIAGAGTVVTGTAWSGSVNVGDEVRLLPSGGTARVRGIEVHGQARDAALPGRRTALALAGLTRRDIARGHVVVHGHGWRETTAVDVMVTLLPASRPLTQRSRVRFHLGTAEVMARVTPMEGEIEPGPPGAARLRLEAPMVCRWGDRGVIRSYSPVTTIGGCVVVDPWPARRPRRPARLAARMSDDPAVRLRAFVEAAGTAGLNVTELTVRVGLSPEDVNRGLGDGVVAVGNRLFAPAIIAAACEMTLAALDRYHREHPLAQGMPRELARRALRDADLADRVHEELARKGQVIIEGQTVRLTSHRARLEGDRLTASRLVLDELERMGKLGSTPEELSQVVAEKEVMALLDYLSRERSVVRVGRDRYYVRAALDHLVRQMLDRIRRTGRATPAQLRDETGLTRKYLIPLLEWTDARLLTVRDGDGRALGPSAGEVLDEVDSG